MSIEALETEIEQGEFTLDKVSALRAEEQFELFKERYLNGHSDYIAKAQDYEDKYRGDQWSEEDLQKLKKEGRPALTLNMILSTINTFLGEQIARRADIQYRPHKDASAPGAHAMSAVAMAVLAANQYEWRESEMVEDGVIRDRGYLNFRVEFDTDMQGEIKITKLHPDTVMWEANSKSYDPAENPGVMISTWETLDDIEARFGEDKAAEIEKTASMQGTLGSESILYDAGEDPMENHGQQWDLPGLTEESRRRIRSVRVIDRQFYKNVRVFVLIDPESMKQRELKPGTKQKEAKALAELFQMHVRAKTVRRLHWRVTADRVVLWEGWSPYKTPTLIPYYPYFRNGEAFGIVKNLVSPQEQYNKISSQELHIVNSTANGGWVVKRGGLLNMTTDELARNGSKAGVVLEVKDLASVDKIQPNQIPTGIASIKQDTQVAIRSIAGMSDSFVGANGTEISGVAMKSKEQRGQVQIQKPLDNLARTRFMVGRKLLELMQGFYTDARVISTVDYHTPGMPTQTTEINMPQPDGEILNDFTKGEYEVNIATMPARDSYDDSQFAEIMNLISAGIPIPGHHAVLYSHLSQKDAIAEEMKAQAGMQEPSEEEIELQQIMQQLQLQDMQAELAEKEARVRELMSRVDLNAAKTAREMTEDDRELRRLIKELQTEREGYQLRLKLQAMQDMNKLDANQQKIRGDLLKQSMTGATNAQTS